MGVSPWFWLKIGYLSISLFKAKQARKMCFTIFSNEKTLFQTINKNALAARLVSLAYNLVPRALFLGFKSALGTRLACLDIRSRNEESITLKY